MDPRDALNEDPDRPNALAQLNNVLGREGFEAFYGEDRRCYLRHIGSGTITALQANPHRPLTPVEIQRRAALASYLDACSEDNLIEEVLLPLFRQLGFHRITAAGHKDKALEYGKDIWMRYTLPTQHRLYFGIQVKKGKLDASGVTKTGNANIAEIHNQALMMLAHVIFDPETNKRVLVDHAFIVAGGEITKAAGNFMKIDQYVTRRPTVTGNESLREPQIEAYETLAGHDFDAPEGREVSVVLPVGCGKSGLLALTPFAAQSHRALLVAPNVKIADQLLKDLTPSDPKFFYLKRKVLDSAPFPEPAEIRGTSTNVSGLEEADIVVTNIHQLQRAENTWLAKLPADFFDLIMFDEGHHNVAESWDTLRRHFPDARIVNVSATPGRADGRIMAGEIIYSYPISRAVEKGYVKRINGYRLNPTTLHYVRRPDDNTEVEVSLDEVRRLGERDAGFRRSIVSSEATLTTIAEASRQKLVELREKTGEARLKIIASALNMEHCKQVVAKFRELGLRADFVHSQIDGKSKANEQVYQRLENHELDVIVQVRKLGEGFDHPYLSVAAVFSIFNNLSPFMQFVGRIMRVIPDVDPFDAVNHGVVVFHVGGNITGVWNDFQEFAEADQEFFAQLIDETVVEPLPTREPPPGGGQNAPLPVITGQADIQLET